MRSYILTLICPDRPGIVNAVTGTLLEVGGNITESAQFGDSDTDTFVLRTVFESDRDESTVSAALETVATEVQGSIRVRPADRPPKALIMVSRQDHCLLDLLYRRRNGDLPIDVPLVVSNHMDCADIAARYGVEYVHLPVTPDSKTAAEAELMALVERHAIDFVVLARYMQVLSDDVCRAMPGRIINIHHSFLPGFKGPRPYHQAHVRGVKLIGATAHYVTAELDEGPIIEQDVARVSHADSPSELVSIGRDVERMVLARAVKKHAEDRVLLIGAKTVVFP
jgi:formyltetrahydrofolate deformylase